MLEIVSWPDTRRQDLSSTKSKKTAYKVATLVIAGVLGIIYVTIRFFAANRGEQINQSLRGNLYGDGIFSREAKLITAIGVCFLLFFLVTTGIRKLFAALGIEEEVIIGSRGMRKSDLSGAKTGQLYLRNWKRQLTYFAVWVAVGGLIFLLRPAPKFLPLLYLVPLFIVIYKMAQRKKQALQGESKNEDQGKVDE